MTSQLTADLEVHPIPKTHARYILRSVVSLNHSWQVNMNIGVQYESDPNEPNEQTNLSLSRTNSFTVLFLMLWQVMSRMIMMTLEMLVLVLVLVLALLSRVYDDEINENDNLL